MPKIKYCIWDVGKTIYDYSLKPLDEWFLQKVPSPQEYSARKGIKSYDYNPYMKGEQSFEEFCADICQSYGLKPSVQNTIMINKKLHEGVGQYYPQSFEAMKLLKAQGVENCILSNALPILADTSRTQDLIKPEHMFPSYKIGLLKPNPKAFEWVKNSLGCTYSEMMFIDDKSKNVDAAKALGIAGIVYKPETVLENIKSTLNFAYNQHKPLTRD